MAAGKTNKAAPPKKGGNPKPAPVGAKPPADDDEAISTTTENGSGGEMSVDEACDCMVSALEKECDDKGISVPKSVKGAGGAAGGLAEGWIDELALPLILAFIKWFQSRRNPSA